MNRLMTQPDAASMIQTTMELRTVDGICVPFQSGIPVPSFDAQERLTLDLKGIWKKERFAADHDFSLSPRDERWFERLRAEAAGRTGVEFDDANWDTRKLPLPENDIQGKEEANSSETYEDGVWYRRTFVLGTEWANKAVTLHALSISYIADIWVNGHWVGYHEGGFTPFALDLSSYVKAGEVNTIALRIDNPPWGSRVDIIPATPGTDFFNYTGIIHDLYISGSSCCHIARVDAVPLDEEGSVRFTVVLENRGSLPVKSQVEGQIFDADGECAAFLNSPRAADIKGNQAAWDGNLSWTATLAPYETRAVEMVVRIREPRLWAFWKPDLYVAEFSVTMADTADEADRFATQFGLRTVTTEGTRLLLNGRPVFLAGIARHEEWPDTGRSATWERIRDDLAHMRQSMHVNFVRTGHYPNHVYTSVLTDRLGLATISEIPLWQFKREHYEAQEQKRLCDQMWREMIFSQYNRPSILMWSTQNESVEVELRTKYNIRVVQDLREHYADGRLTTQSAAADQPGAHDPSMEPLDVAGWTMYFGIFHGSTYYEGTRDFLQKVQELWPNKPVWNTEFGHWSSERDTMAAEQVKTYKETFQALVERAVISSDGEAEWNADGFLVGIDFWIMYDWFVNHNNWIDTFGIFHMDRKTMKPVGDLLRQDYERLTAFEGGFIKQP
ncbi:glycoside hydrolase family 2 [Paenibacillus sp. MER TA 81-3]|uniref:glycoside hydrolase family 2 protein n=1 Tax=Paenibacillus sp. MER TA 81-3 TaxID=2939573 RepID=UPI00203C0315|nr:glycoside hydrolase family 2 TIM barrel-domain containing protein [Paenibacillus sp. MER TA 81-3]MCM3337632.1 glycoside hydrolase family 2 [Paenibacillus sp. MER TA 81-3]